MSLLFHSIALMEISKILNTGLDPETLAICVKLCEAGVNPEALASVILELRREASALQVKAIMIPTEPQRIWRHEIM